ncbi:MAG: HNH endonuclease signature motif containing protein [Desulfobacteraceae bacterium]|nr:HNH endonuclease signature motif containing protein [Desulfobacteraceae bacterium]
MPLFLPVFSEDDIQKEKNKARQLKYSNWWKNKCAKGVCHYCGRNVGPVNLTMDHVVPLVRGGKSVKTNLVPACGECNGKKKYLLPMEWDEYINELNGL